MSSCLGSSMLVILGAQGTMKMKLIFLGFYYTKTILFRVQYEQ